VIAAAFARTAAVSRQDSAVVDQVSERAVTFEAVISGCSWRCV
jgi:hypothetical protein